MKSNNSVFSCIGASNHSKYEREANDFYSTDESAIQLLDKHNLLDKEIGGGGN